MSKLSKDASGFLVEGLLVVLAAALIVFAGWHIWHAKDKAKSSISTTQAIVASSNVKNYTTWDAMPPDVQGALLAAWTQFSPGYKTDPNVDCPTDAPQANVTAQDPVLVDNDRYAIGGVGCDGGAVVLFAKVNDAWQLIEQTQDGFSCDIVQKYNFPLNLLIAENAVQTGSKVVTCVQPDGSTKTLNS